MHKNPKNPKYLAKTPFHIEIESSMRRDREKKLRRKKNSEN